MKRRPETAYSITRYEIMSELPETSRLKPHTTLEQRKFSSQMKICYVTPRRQTLIKSTEIKSKKEIHEWIQNCHPNGMEILSKIAKQTRSNYKSLINKALNDLRIVEKRANIMDKKDLIEKSQNSDEVENQIIEYEKKLQKAKEDNQRLKSEIINSQALYNTMNDDICKLQSVLKNVQSKFNNSTDNVCEHEAQNQIMEINSGSSTNKSDIQDKRKVAKSVDTQSQTTIIQMKLLKEEEKRLEQQLIKLETKLMELNLEERSLLYGQFLHSTSTNSQDNSS